MASVMREANVEVMNKLEGFDVVIICCSSSLQAKYWQQRLEAGRGSILPVSSIVVSVEEDWPGGAGNALGTLYAFQKAAKIATETHQMDMAKDLSEGKISIGLFHTAGKGTRLAPLPGAENNNKPGVKLPTTIQIGGEALPISILESVIKQTGCYSKSRLGRLSVFWGDQVFIPTVSVEYTPTYHADILCSLGPMMSESDWKEKGMEKYGLIAQTARGAAQVEKVDHATAVKLLSSLGEIVSVGASLGSFSVSSALLCALLSEFSAELASKKGKLDSDPHLWMPMTLEKDSYLQLMSEKGVTGEVAGAHFERIQAMMKTFHADTTNSSLGVFGPVDVGQGVYWWDYGQLRLYQQYTLMMTENTEESALMRKFFGIDSADRTKDSTVGSTSVDDLSCISSCSLGSGSVKNSLLSNVHCNQIDAEGCVLINVTANKITAREGCIIYNIADGSAEGLDITAGKVLAGVFSKDGSHKQMHSSIDTDGGKAWDTVLEGNEASFEGVYNANADVCVATLQNVIKDAHKALWLKLLQSKKQRVSK